MNKTYLVARREFRQRIRSRGFLIQIVLMPLVLVAVVFFTGLAGDAGETPGPNPSQWPEEPVGLVDRAGIVATIPDSVPDNLVRRYADEAAAAAALDQGEISAYYVVEESYRTSGEVRWVGETLPNNPPDSDWFQDILTANVLRQAGADVQSRLRSASGEPEVTVIQPGPEAAAGDNGLNWAPLVVVLLVLMPLFTAGGYLFEGLVQEKSNRIVEVLLSSLRPSTLLSGKMFGLGLLALVQYAAWAAIGFALLRLMGLARGSAPTPAGIPLTAQSGVFLVLYALGAYALYAALMAGIGAMTASIDNNRILIFIVTLPMILPLYLWGAIVQFPDEPLAVALSLIPFTSPVAMLMRLTVTTVPPWQVGASLVLLYLTAAATLWLMSRLFRAQTLLSGESLSPRRMWAALRS